MTPTNANANATAATTAAAALRIAVQRLTTAGIDGAARDARLLLADAMGVAADRLTLHLPDQLAPEALARFDAHVTARSAHQPVAQIIGSRLFWGQRFIVTPDTLDPRPETELLVAEALAHPFMTVLDLGTGTGCILLSCLAVMPMACGVGSDISHAALAVAQRNAAALGVTARARFVQSDWFADLPGRYDLICANPPYIAADEMAQLSPDVARWEPHLALSPGGDGLDAYRAIALGAAAHLVDNGRLLLEIGPTQAVAVLALLAASGFGGLRVICDLDGRDRVVVAIKPASGADRRDG